MLRLAADQDLRQIKDLWNYCFDDTPEFVDFYFNTCYKPENTLVAEEGGRILSCLQLLPYSMYLRGRTVPVCYIVGVATWPEYRGQGLVKQLLKYADEVLRSRNIHISILLPFRYDFYRKYGWEICYDLLKYKSVEIAGKFKSSYGRYEKVDIKDADKLSDCYLRFMKPFNGYIIRTARDWEKILRDIEMDNGTGYFYKENDMPLGYILYTISDKNLIIKELVYNTPHARKALLQLAANHSGQVENIIRYAPAYDTDYLQMADPRGKLEKQTYVMGRIHDIGGALSGLTYMGEGFVIQVKDSFSEESKCYFIEQVNQVSNAAETCRDADIVTDIQTLNQLLWGYIHPYTALAEGMLNCRDDRAMQNLAKLFPPMCNYMTEDY